MFVPLWMLALAACAFLGLAIYAVVLRSHIDVAAGAQQEVGRVTALAAGGALTLLDAGRPHQAQEVLQAWADSLTRPQVRAAASRSDPAPADQL